MQTGQQEGSMWLLFLGGLVFAVVGAVTGDGTVVVAGVGCAVVGGGILFALRNR